MADIQTQLPIKVSDGSNTVAIVGTALKVDNSAVTQPVSGTITNVPSGTQPVSGTITNVPSGTQTVAESSLIADNAGFTDGTSKVMASGFIFDEEAGTTLTENDVAAARINANRALIFTIEDETTRGRRTVVTAANALKVDNSAVTQPVSGTITANVGTGTQPVSGTITNVPSGTQTVAGTITNVPSGTQPVSGTITANAGTGTLAVSGTVTNVPSGTQTVAGTVTNVPSGTQTVAGTLDVAFGEVSTGVIAFYDTATSVANSSTGTISYTVTTGNTLYLKGVLASSSGAPCKVIVDYGAGPTVIAVGFYASAVPFLNITFAQPILIAEDEVVNVKIQNNAGSAQDVYATILGHEVAD